MATDSGRQLRGLDERVTCDVCGRTMLKGERPEPYLAPSRERKIVCQLCAQRAQKEGWIREAGNATPVQPPRPSDRGRFFRRRRRRTPAEESALDPQRTFEPEAEPAPNGGSARRGDDFEGPRSRDPRHVHAVPTSADLKIERAVQLFNESEHPKTVAGIARALGSPNVSASTSTSSSAEVLLTVAWEISWYRYVVDLSDTNAPVRERDRGHELAELPSEAREWNASADEEGRIVVPAGENSDGETDPHDL